MMKKLFSNSCYCKGVVRFFISDWLRIQFGREQAFYPPDKIKRQTDAVFALQYQKDGETYYGDCYTRVTPDEKFIFAEIGTDIGEDIRFAVFKDN